MKIIPHPLPRNKTFKYKRISDDALLNNSLSAFARLLLIVLVNWDKNPNASFRPNITFFANNFNVSKRTIDRAVSELSKHGYLYSTGIKDNTVWEIHEIPKRPQVSNKNSKAKPARNDVPQNVKNDATLNVMDGAVTKYN